MSRIFSFGHSTWVRRLFYAFAALLLVLAAAITVYVYRTFPALSGELKAAGLSAPQSPETQQT